jgi:hypothetical protein
MNLGPVPILRSTSAGFYGVYTLLKSRITLETRYLHDALR